MVSLRLSVFMMFTEQVIKHLVVDDDNMEMNEFASIESTERVLDVLSTTEYASISTSDRTDILEWLLEATMMLQAKLYLDHQGSMR